MCTFYCELLNRKGHIKNSQFFYFNNVNRNGFLNIIKSVFETSKIYLSMCI